MDIATLARFWRKVDVRGGCWNWTAAVSKGYGHFGLAGKTVEAHRLSYSILNGPIPSGFELDHLCLNKRCVNPLHLEAVPVEGRENTRRYQAAKTRCLRGHEYTQENTYIQIVKGRPSRSCKICRRDALRAFEASHPGRSKK